MPEKTSFTKQKETAMLERLLAEVSVDRAWEHVDWLTRNAPERLSGTPQARQVDDYLVDRLGEYGLEVDAHQFDALLSFPQPARIEVLTPQVFTVSSRAKGQSMSTPTGGLEAELVYAGQGGEGDYEGIDARGRIVLTELSYAPPRPEKARIAMSKGAAALVIMNWGLPEHDAISYGTVKPVWGLPTPESMKLMPSIPAVGITRGDGERLKSLCAAGPVRVRMHSKAGREWVRSQEITARLRGTAEPEKFVLVGGHVDSWGGGVTCNATGTATKLELARAFAALRGDLKRSIVFAFWMGHETGIMEGSTWFVDNRWDDLRDNGLLYLNIDSPGLLGTNRPFTWSSPETIAFHSEIEKRILGRPAERDRLKKTGDQSFFGVGMPSINARTIHSAEDMARWHGATLGWWYHSDLDTIDKADKSILEGSLKLYAAYVEDLANRPVLRYNFTATADEFLGRLEQLQEESRGSIDLTSLQEKASRLRDRAVALEAARSEVERTSDAIVDPWPSPQAKIVNQTLMKMSRVLTPSLSTVAGKHDQDTYGLTVLNKPIPGMGEVAKMGAMDPDAEERKLLLTKLMRERNKVSDALDDACWLVDITLERLGATP